MKLFPVISQTLIWESMQEVKHPVVVTVLCTTSIGQKAWK